MNLDITFLTGNVNKAQQLQQWLGMTIHHQAVDLEEIQSLSLEEITNHKAKQAYERIGKPVLVEDVELVFTAIGPLPGPFIKWFQVTGLDKLCHVLDGFDDRTAHARVLYSLYDGTSFRLFEGRVDGLISLQPSGLQGFGFDPIFIPEGYTQTRAEMNEADYAATSPRKFAIDKLKEELVTGNKSAQ